MSNVSSLTIGMNLYPIHPMNIDTVQSHIPLEPLHPCKEPPSGLNDIRTFMPIYIQSLAHFEVSVAKPMLLRILDKQ